MTMPNKAIHQLAEATSLQDGDVLVVSRPSGGSFVDRSVDAATFPQRLQYAAITVPVASVLTLGDTPVIVVPGPSAGEAIVLKNAVLKMVNGTTDYATSTTLSLGTDGGGDIAQFDISGAAASPMVPGFLGGKITTASDLILTAGGVNPTDGNYDLEIQVWYTVITL